MAEREEAGQPQRYCRNCGTEVRPGNTFCVSCGASLTPRTEEPEPTYSGPELWGRLVPFIGAVWAAFQRATQRLRGTPEAFSGATLRGMPGRTIRWFKELPVVARAVIAGVAALILLAVLSLLALFAALLALGVSVIALIVRACQRRSTGRWPIVAVASLVLTFAFGGISEALYGIAPLGDAGVTGSGTKDGDKRGVAASTYEDVAPELKEVAEQWSASNRELPLLLPRHLPIPVVDVKPTTKGIDVKHGTGYNVEGPITKCFGETNSMSCQSGVLLVLGERGRPSPPSKLPAIEIDGRSYYYDASEINGLSEMQGQYRMVLWVQSSKGEGEFFPYEVTLTYKTEVGNTWKTVPLEEFMEMISSMRRIDPSGS